MYQWKNSVGVGILTRHAGQLANEQVLEELQRQIDVASLSFGAVWLVGSTAAGSRRLAFDPSLGGA